MHDSERRLHLFVGVNCDGVNENVFFWYGADAGVLRDIRVVEPFA